MDNKYVTNLIHGHTAHGQRRSPTYISWEGMKKRCDYPAARGYERYGALGITYCESWATFANFLADMGERPEGASLDRIDPKGNYEPGNCRWASPKEQSRNKHNTSYLTYRGETRPLMDWAERFGIGPKTLRFRVFNRGMSVEEALETPVPVRKKYTIGGVTKNLNGWAKSSGIPYITLYGRVVQRGIPLEEALRIPGRN